MRAPTLELLFDLCLHICMQHTAATAQAAAAAHTPTSTLQRTHGACRCGGSTLRCFPARAALLTHMRACRLLCKEMSGKLNQ